jgi:hypothetical protein
MEAPESAVTAPGLDAWRDYLRKTYCPAIDMRGDPRVLIELQDAEDEKQGTSYINKRHVKYGCDAIVKIIKQEELTGPDGAPTTVLVIPFYTAQVHAYQSNLDELVRDKKITREQRQRIDVRTVDSSAHGYAATFVLIDFVRMSNPGITCEIYRLRVALTRARMAEMILMSRGIFDDFKPHGDTPVELDVRLLEKIFKPVSGYRGKLIVKANSTPWDQKSKLHCHNCGKNGHHRKRCTRRLRCSNCGQPDHTPLTCALPIAKRCYICTSTDHTKEDCPHCHTCRSLEHPTNQ